MNNKKWKKISSSLLAVCLVVALLVSNQSFGVLAEEDTASVAVSAQEETDRKDSENASEKEKRQEETTAEQTSEIEQEKDEDAANEESELTDAESGKDGEQKTTGLTDETKQEENTTDTTASDGKDATISRVAEDDTLQDISVQAEVEDADTVTMDLYYGDITFSDDTVTYYDEENTQQSISYEQGKKYRITQTDETKATNHTISVGTEKVAVTKAYTIYLAGVNIDAPNKQDNHKAAIYVNTSQNTVNLVLENNSKNTVVAYAYGTADTSITTHFTHSAIEKEINTKGTLRITCEAGLNSKGHTCTKNGSCGSLTATAKSNNKVYWNGAGIGSKGYIGNNHDHSGTESASGTMYNLVIAGGVITATGASGSGNGGGPGIGIAQSGPDSAAVGYNAKGLEIDGGYIIAKAGNGATTNIGGGFHSGYVEMTINGGYIEALRGDWNIGDWFQADVGAAIGGGSGGSSTSAFFGTKVTINGGTIKARAAYGAAIGSSAGGANGDGAPATVIINGGTIEASTEKGYGAAIGTGGSAAQETTSGNMGKASDANIEIHGGTITADSQYGADIGGGGTQSTQKTAVGGNATINITDGKITTTGNGLGGGLASAGQGGNASIHISGGTITTTSIGGGDSDANKAGDASVYISAGTLNVTGKIGGGNSKTGTPGTVASDSQTAGIVVTGGTLKAGTIGGGTNASGDIGFATADISGGDIQGQFVLANTDANKKCTFTMTGGTIDNTELGNDAYQKASENGGAVYLSDPNGIVNISGGTIKNSTAELGGAIYMTAGTFELSETGNIYKCDAEQGGAIYLGDGDIKISGGQISGNTAVEGAGAYLANGQLNVSGGTITGNTASDDGGGFYLAGGQLYITDGTIQLNIAKNGAGAYVADSTVRMFGGNFTGNIASENGGGLYVSSEKQAADVVIRSGDLVNNKAENTAKATDQGNGGAIAVVSSSSSTVDRVVIGVRENHTDLDISTRKFTTFTYVDNKDTDSEGQGIEHTHAACPKIEGNQATGNGGGIYMSSSSSILDIFCLLENNNTAAADATGGSIMSVGGHVNIGDIDETGNGNNTKEAVGNIFIQSPMLVKGGNVRICGNTENPSFAKEILVDIKKGTEGTEGSFEDERFTKVSNDVSYVIEYFENFEGSGAYKSLQYADGSDIYADGSLYKHDGYKILGWDTDPNATSPTYQSGTLIGSKEQGYGAWDNLGDTGALKLYAIWKKISYIVEYYPGVDDYTGRMDPQTFEYGVLEDANGKKIALRPNAFKVTGKRFVNWKTEDGQIIEDQYDKNDLTLTDGKTIKLYAQWRDCTHDEKEASYPNNLSYTLNLDEDMITESCDCGGYTASVTIKGTDAYYDGTAHPATLQYSNGTLLEGTPEIAYSYKANETGDFEPMSANAKPITEGYYKASITVDGKIAHVEYRIKSPAEAATIDVTVQKGQYFDAPKGSDSCSVSRDDAFTVRFNVQGLNKGTNDGAEKAYQTAPVLTLSTALPSGTTIIMQTAGGYWYNNQPSGTEIALASFYKMGTKIPFSYDTSAISDEQDYRFVIDFSGASNRLTMGTKLQVGLKYAYKDSGTGSVEAASDKEKQATITMAAESVFSVTVSGSACTVAVPDDVTDTRWKQKNLVWKIAADTSTQLPADARLTMTTVENGETRTKTSSLNKNGEFVLPITWKNGQSYTFSLNSQQEAVSGKAYALTAELYIGSNAEGNTQLMAAEDNLKKAAASVSLTVPVVETPALKISAVESYGQQRVLSASDTLHIHIEYTNINMDECSIKAIIQKETESGYDGNLSEQPVSKTGDYAFSMSTTKGAGNYRVWVTVAKKIDTDHEQTVLQVPYYFIVQ